MARNEKCGVCGGAVGFRFRPMEEWGIEGTMCGKCYSKRIDDHYPGDHIRVNRRPD